jgi:hypothetical protein
MESDRMGDALARFAHFKPMPAWVESLVREMPRGLSAMVVLLGILWAAVTIMQIPTGDFFWYAFGEWGLLTIILLALKVFWYNSQKRKRFKKAFPHDAAELGM